MNGQSLEFLRCLSRLNPCVPTPSTAHQQPTMCTRFNRSVYAFSRHGTKCACACMARKRSQLFAATVCCSCDLCNMVTVASQVLACVHTTINHIDNSQAQYTPQPCITFQSNSSDFQHVNSSQFSENDCLQDISSEPPHESRTSAIDSVQHWSSLQALPLALLETASSLTSANTII